MNKTKTGILAITVLGLAVGAGSALAQSATSRYPITPQQQSTAEQVAQAGVPLAALAPNAPDRYTVKRGDTLWDLSSMYLTSPWRWPELWGMNKDQISNNNQTMDRAATSNIGCLPTRCDQSRPADA